MGGTKITFTVPVEKGRNKSKGDQSKAIFSKKVKVPREG